MYCWGVFLIFLDLASRFFGRKCCDGVGSVGMVGFFYLLFFGMVLIYF